MPNVAEQDVKSVRNWLDLFDGAIYAPETEYLNHRDELIYVAPLPDSTFRRLFKCLTMRYHLSWFRKRSDLEMGYEEPSLVLWDEEAVRSFFDKATMVVGFGMVIGPLWVLESVSGPLQRLGVILLLCWCFCCCCRWLRRGGPLRGWLVLQREFYRIERALELCN